MIGIILAAAVALTLIVLVMLNWSRILDWFNKREELRESDKDNIAVGIKQALDDGKVTYVQGIFNKRTNELKEGTKYEAEELDDQLKEYHSRDELVVFQ
jgi:hypothetical protein